MSHTNKTRYSISDIRRRAQRRTSNLYDSLFTRNVSIWVTFALAPQGVSPNSVTAVNCLVGAAGCLLIAFGVSAPAVVGGVALIHVYSVLDSVDGELARLLGSSSIQGMFLEDWSAYGMITAFPLAVSLYLYAQGASWIVVLIAVFFAVAGRNAMPAVRRAIAKSFDAAEAGDHKTTELGSRTFDSGWWKYVEDHVLHHTNIRLVLTSLVLLDVTTGGFRLPAEMAFYGYMSGLFCREAGIIYLAMRKDLIEQERRRLRQDVEGSAGHCP